MIQLYKDALNLVIPRWRGPVDLWCNYRFGISKMIDHYKSVAPKIGRKPKASEENVNWAMITNQLQRVFGVVNRIAVNWSFIFISYLGY